MTKFKFVLGCLIASFVVCLIFMLNVKAAEVGNYSYNDAESIYNVEIVDDKKCIVTQYKDDTKIITESGYTDLENGNIYITKLDSEFKFGLASTLILVEKKAEVTEKEEVAQELKIDEETLNKLLDLAGKFSNGEYKEAFEELKVGFGIVGAFAIICALICFLFIIKYFKQSALIKKIEERMSVEQATQTNEFINDMEKKCEALLETYMKKMQDVDSDKKEQLQEMVKAIDTKLASIK